MVRGFFLIQHDKLVHKEIILVVWRGRTWLVSTEPGPQPHSTPLRWSGMPTASKVWPYHPPSLPDFTDTLVAEWDQIPVARLQNLVENHLSWMKTIIAADKFPGFQRWYVQCLNIGVCLCVHVLCSHVHIFHIVHFKDRECCILA